MKNLQAWILAGMVTVALTGCGKKEQAAAPAPKVEKPVAEQPAAQAESAIAQPAAVVDNAAAAVTNVATEAKTQVAEVTAAAKSAFDTTVAEIKKLIDAQSYTDALAKITQASGLENLTAEQKGILDNLLELVKSKMAATAKGATDVVKDAKALLPTLPK